MIQYLNEIDLDNADYMQIDLSSQHCFYIIGINNNTEVQNIVFSVAVDSGVTGKPLEIQNIQLPINGEISGTRYTGFPDTFFLKPVQVTLKSGQSLKTGLYDIKVNINPMSFM